jgi:hypothetical protein
MEMKAAASVRGGGNDPLYGDENEGKSAMFSMFAVVSYPRMKSLLL